MAKKKKTRVYTPLQEAALKLCDGADRITIADMQRSLRCSFVKACELVKFLSDKGLIKSNIEELAIWS